MQALTMDYPCMKLSASFWLWCGIDPFVLSYVLRGRVKALTLLQAQAGSPSSAPPLLMGAAAAAWGPDPPQM